MQAIAATSVLTLPKTMKLGLNVNLTCQTAIWKRSTPGEEIEIWKVSTGREEFETVPGRFKVGWLVDGWYESRKYPEGWMYRPQFFNGGQAIHGTRDADAVHSYPASHGCVRMKRANIDYLWANGFAIDPRVNVYGRWIWHRTN
jgi:lipoprotein-anchoring transpeptidase ErfK/SrfK